MKPISQNGHAIRPFRVHKTNEITYTEGASSSPVYVDEAVFVSASAAYDPTSDVRNPTGISKRLLYNSVQHLFYMPSSRSIPVSYTPFEYAPTEFYVMNIHQRSYGEGIAPGSVVITDGASTLRYVDDGSGRLVVAGTTVVVGNVFYSQGILVIAKADLSSPVGAVSYNPALQFSPTFFPTYFNTTPFSIFAALTTPYNPSPYFNSEFYSKYFGNLFVGSLRIDGMVLSDGDQLTIVFDSSHTIYEHMVMCTMEPGEYNYSMNPSIRRDGVRTTLDAFASGTLTPYLTTVGLFSTNGELVAVAKFPKPIKRATESQQTVIIRFDA